MAGMLAKALSELDIEYRRWGNQYVRRVCIDGDRVGYIDAVGVDFYVRHAGGLRTCVQFEDMRSYCTLRIWVGTIGEVAVNIHKDKLDLKYNDTGIWIGDVYGYPHVFLAMVRDDE